MKNLEQLCELLRNSLLDIDRQCDNLGQSIGEYSAMVSTLPATMVKNRLGLIAVQIIGRMCALLIEHNRQGHVFVMKSSNLLGVYWMEKEFSSEDKDDFSKRGYSILSKEEIVKMVNQLSEKVDSWQFTEAVDWINRYEPAFTNNPVRLG